MSGSPMNRCLPSDLTEADVQAALGRIRADDPSLADEAEHVFDSLTWGEGPGVIRQAGLQEWLWYVVPTKYLTDEPGYMGRLAEAAATLFDELGLHGYAAICRSDETAEVHAAFDRSQEAGRDAMRRSIGRSGIDPPDLDDFAWGSVMRTEEAEARSAVEVALEEAIFSSRMTVGARGWRVVQADVTAEVLESNHPDLPGQSLRTAVVTERIEQWISGDRASLELAEARGGVANRLLHPIEPPAGGEGAVQPLKWLLERWGDEQPLTQAGYLKPAFVQSLQADRPWTDPLPLHRAVKTELDDVVLHRLRSWLQSVGALRKHKGTLRRTTTGRSMADDWQVGWQQLAEHLCGDGWDGFAAETALLFVLRQSGPVGYDAVVEFVRSCALDMGWQTTVDGVPAPPSPRDVAWSVADASDIWEACALVEHHGEWRSRQLALTAVGQAAALAYLRHVATGPKAAPW